MKANIRILLAVMLIFAMALSMAACGSTASAAKAVEAAPAAEETADAADAADYVITGKIYVDAENTVSALAIKDGIIIYSGDEDGVAAYIGENTNTIALAEGETVTAGFVDAHTHNGSCWDTKLSSAQIPNGATREECVEIISAFVAENPGRPYYKATGWINSAFETAAPQQTFLTPLIRISPSSPPHQTATASGATPQPLSLPA